VSSRNFATLSSASTLTDLIAQPSAATSVHKLPYRPGFKHHRGLSTRH
jgi:hypothetical protein